MENTRATNQDNIAHVCKYNLNLRRVKDLVLTNKQYLWGERIINNEDFYIFRTLQQSIVVYLLFKKYLIKICTVITPCFRTL